MINKKGWKETVLQTADLKDYVFLTGPKKEEEEKNAQWRRRKEIPLS